MNCCQKIIDYVKPADGKNSTVIDDLDDLGHTSINKVIKILVVGPGFVLYLVYLYTILSHIIYELFKR